MTDDQYMEKAIEEARMAMAEDEIPVGAVIVKKDQIIASAHNQKEALRSVTAHAEILAIEEACHRLNSWRLENCTLYVTLEPCMMCSGAIYQSHIRRVVIGTRDNRWPGLISYMRDYDLNYIPRIELSHYQTVCQRLLQEYFHKKRKKKTGQ